MEQRLFRPVFEEIDAGRPAGGLEQLQRLTRKAPKTASIPLFQALKCLCHQRLDEEDLAIEVFNKLLKDDGEKKSSSGSGSKGKAAAKGKGGRQALLKKMQQSQSPAPTEAEAKANEKGPIDDAEQTTPPRVFDDDVINVLQFALKGLGKYPELRQIYLDAWNADGRADVEKGAQAFLCSLRMRDWAGMQETALFMLKDHGEDPKPSHWAAMSYYLQAIDPSTSEGKKPLLLSLAYTLITSYPANPYRSPDVFILYVQICRAAGALHRTLPQIKTGQGIKNGSALEKEALEALTPDLRKAEKDVEFEAGWWTAVAGDLRIKWERWELVTDISSSLATNSKSKPVATPNVDVDEDVPDADESDTQLPQQNLREVSWMNEWDWEKEWERGDDQLRGAADLPETNYKAYLAHISVLFLLLSRPTLIKNTAKTPATYLAETRRTLLELASQPTFAQKERAPLLAMLEIDRRLRETGTVVQDETKGGADTVPILKVYLAEFGHKGCVRDDLLPYLRSTQGRIAPEVEDLLERTIAIETTTSKDYTRKLNAYKLLRYASSPPTNEDDIKAGKTYLVHYFEGARHGEDFPVTEVKPADDFGMMAAQAWIRAWWYGRRKQDASVYLVLAISVLERILKDSPANGQARMLLIRLYRLIGAPSLFPKHITPLKMRTFQQDTALHFVTERSTADYIAGGEETRTALAGLLLKCKEVYERTQTDVGELSLAAVTQESYSQIPSMLELGNKFQHSHQRQLTELELVRHSAMRDSNELLGSDRSVALQNLSLFDSISAKDLRDWDLFPDYGPADSEQDLISQTQLDGSLTTPQSIHVCAELWRHILDPGLSSSLELSGVDCTTNERNLADFATGLSHFVTACGAGEVGDYTTMTGALERLSELQPEDHGRIAMDRAATIMECYAMLEIAAAPYKVKTGKKGKGVSASTVPQEVAGAVRDLFKACQDIIRDYATRYKAFEAQDILLGQNYAVDELKRLDLLSTLEALHIRMIEQSVRESRQLATKETFRELKRRSDG